MVGGALAPNRRIGRVPELPNRQPAQRPRGFEERRAQPRIDTSRERLEQQGEHLESGRLVAASRPAASACVMRTTPARRCPPPVSTVRGSVARLRGSSSRRRRFGKLPADLGRHRRHTMDAVDARAVAVGVHDHDIVGERLPTCFERGDRERRLPRAAVPEEQQRSPLAHDRRSVEDEAAMAREQPGEWQIHTALEEGERSKVRQVDVGPVVHHGDDEPRWCGDDDSIGLVPELDAEQLRTRRAGWGEAGVASTANVATGSSSVGSKISRLACRLASRSSSDASNATGTPAMLTTRDGTSRGG